MPAVKAMLPPVRLYAGQCEGVTIKINVFIGIVLDERKRMPLNRTLLTPLFLDTPVPGLEALARPGWVLNKPALPEADTQTRMGVVHGALAEFVAGTLHGPSRGPGRRHLTRFRSPPGV